MKTIRYYIIFYIIISGQALFAQTSDPKKEFVLIDSIVIQKNWRTKDNIILHELEFSSGDIVSKGLIDTSMIKIWNLGNFSSVEYQIHQYEKQTNTLEITAKDALTIIPNLSFNGNKNDFRFSAGINDKNFLGRNIKLNFNVTTGTTDKHFHISTTIPRQLLYKNMALHGSLTYGSGMNYQYKNGAKSLAVGYQKRAASFAISNPWHKDFDYHFSPDISLGFTQHKTDTSLISKDIPTVNDYTVGFFHIGFNESAGYIKHRRHQKDGYQLAIGSGYSIGLTPASKSYFNLTTGAAYHKLLNSIIQFSCSFSTAFTSTHIPSLLFYRNDVKGYYTGEISGQAFYTSSIGSELTWLNRQWLSLVQSIYLNSGNGSNSYLDLFKKKPYYSAYTRLRLSTPAIPWLAFSVDFVWSKRKENWFLLNL